MSDTSTYGWLSDDSLRDSCLLMSSSRRRVSIGHDSAAVTITRPCARKTVSVIGVVGLLIFCALAIVC